MYFQTVAKRPTVQVGLIDVEKEHHCNSLEDRQGY